MSENLVSQNLYNKYRSLSWDEVVEQDHVKQVMVEQLANKKLPHSLIFFGPPGTGKTTVARIVSTTLNPNEEGTVEKDSGVEGKIDNVRQIQSEVLHRPLLGEFKTFIFDEAHRITPAAFGSLLKTIEEPPPFVKFIFVTTDLGAIPDNIKSRSQIHQFVPISIRGIVDRLGQVCKAEKFKLSESALRQIAAASAGSLRDALVKLEMLMACQTATDDISVANVLGLIGTARLNDFIIAFLTENFKKMVESVRVLNSSYTDLTKALHELESFVLDFRFFISYPDLKYGVSSDFSQVEQRLLKTTALTDQVKELMANRVDLLLEALFVAEKALDYTTNKEVILNKLLLRIVNIWRPR